MKRILLALLIGISGMGCHTLKAMEHPYANVYGDICEHTTEVSPGCTFDSMNEYRVKYYVDPDHKSGTLKYVIFDGNGNGKVYDHAGNFLYQADVSTFAGFVGGTQIGIPSHPDLWVDIRNGTYWLGRNGVLYDQNLPKDHYDYGEAINSDDAESATDTNFAALGTAANKSMVTKAAKNLNKEYNIPKEKALAIASALNVWKVASVERGFTTEQDINKTFRTVFGVEYADALTAVTSYHSKSDRKPIQDLTNRSASALGVKPHEAKRFIKDMYKDALASFGYDVESIDW